MREPIHAAMHRYLHLFVLFILFAITGNAQQAVKQLREMNVDIPDQTEGTDLLETKQWQLETALLHNTFHQGTHALIAQTLLRYGILKNVELRFLSENGRQRDRYISETTQSLYPFAVGTKVSLVKDSKSLPDITFVGCLNLPFASGGKNKSYWSPLLLLAFQNKLSADWELEYNLGVQQEAFSTEWQKVASASLHYKISDAFAVFTEYYAGFLASESPQHNVGGGITWQVNNYLEAYLSGGSTIMNDEPNHFFSGGMALQLP